MNWKEQRHGRGKVFIIPFLKSTLVSVAWVQVCESLFGMVDIVSQGKSL